MKKFLCILVVFVLTIALFSGCNPTPKGYFLNGLSLEEYTIVYSATDPDYTKRAADYLCSEIETRTNICLTVTSDQEQAEPLAHEIVIGETNRQISANLDADTQGFQFSMLADDAHIAMEGDYFVIAAAAYYFVETYIQDKFFESFVAKEETVLEPIVRQAENYIVLIGDGMGIGQTRLFDVFSAEALNRYSDGESEFYGYMFPYMGMSRTDSLSGTTDSAAGGTALATGYKTFNSYVGKDENLNDVTSLTEIAIELGMATAVGSTEVLTGATPAAFTAHTSSRENTVDILGYQNRLMQEHGTKIFGGHGSMYDEGTINRMELLLQQTLNSLAKDEDGFFMMYEEAYIDKHCHSLELQNTFYAVLRFNQIIGCVMEFAFYHPETFVLITADHETGGVTKKDDGSYYYAATNHTSADVPVFVYGFGAEVFDDITVENVQIPKTIAAMWGVEIEGYDNAKYPSLIAVH